MVHGFLVCLRSQESREPHPVVGGIGELDSQGLGRSEASEAGAGFKEIMIDNLGFGEGGQTEVAFETSEGSGSGFEKGPFAFELVVVGVFEEGSVDQMAFWLDAEILECADIAPQSVGKDLGLLHLWRGMIGHGEGVAGGLSVASGGEIVAEVRIVSGDISEPKPSFFSSAFEAGLVSEDTWFSPAFLGHDGEWCAFVGEEKSGFMTPSGDGVVGDLDLEEVSKCFDNARSGHGLEEGEIEGESDGGGGEFHFVPVKERLDFALDETDLFGFKNKIESFLSGQGDVDFMGAFAIALGIVPVTPESQGVAEMFENAHVRATFGAKDFGVFSLAGGAAWDKLAVAARVFAPIALHLPTRIETESMDVSATAGTADIKRRFACTGHDKLLSGKGC